MLGNIKSLPFFFFFSAFNYVYMYGIQWSAGLGFLFDFLAYQILQADSIIFFYPPVFFPFIIELIPNPRQPSKAPKKLLIFFLPLQLITFYFLLSPKRLLATLWRAFHLFLLKTRRRSKGVEQKVLVKKKSTPQHSYIFSSFFFFNDKRKKIWHTTRFYQKFVCVKKKSCYPLKAHV